MSNLISADSYNVLTAEQAESIASQGLTIGSADAVTVRIPSGGSTKWMFSDFTGDVVSDDIEGVLVWWNAYWVLWPSDEPQADSKPVAVSFDGVTGWLINGGREGNLGSLDIAEFGKVGTDHSFSMAECFYNRPGSDGRGGKGRRFKEQRHLYILQDNRVVPLKVVVSAGSLWNVNRTLLGMMATGPCYKSVVKLSLDKAKTQSGIEYSQVKMSVSGQLDQPKAEVARTMYHDALKADFLAEQKQVAEAAPF
jgi:hypothetical protein